MKYIVVLISIFLVSACDDYIKQEDIPVIIHLCEHHEGWKYAFVDHQIRNQIDYRVVCNDGSVIEKSFKK